MKQISFISYKVEREEEIQVRNNRQQLILDIVNNTTEPDKKSLAKRIAIVANQLKWSDMDLHALLKKRHDPKVYNYTGFVKYSLKVINTH